MKLYFVFLNNLKKMIEKVAKNNFLLFIIAFIIKAGLFILLMIIYFIIII